MPLGREHQMFRENIHAFVARKIGNNFLPVATMGAVVGQVHIAPQLMQMKRGYFKNDDGSVWSPQNPDGSFPFLEGYDGPLNP